MTIIHGRRKLSGQARSDGSNACRQRSRHAPSPLRHVYLYAVVLFAALFTATDAKVVTIHNDQPRVDIEGNYVDAHDGKIVVVNGTYFLYGEAYGNQTLATSYPWKTVPRLNVYTSPDLVQWTLRGDPLPMVEGTLWIPNVLYNASTHTFLMWYGSGGWCTATSSDGIHFTPVRSKFFSRFGPKARTDGTGIFIDDDGVGYVAFAASPAGLPDHVVSIERLADDYLSTTRINVTGLFPDSYVESPSLWKRSGVYYLTYGSCCCGCAGGGGQVVFTSTSGVAGPWTRQAHADINCNSASAPVCGAYGKRMTGSLVFPAQWWGPSFIPLKDGTTQVLYLGRRWLSGPNRPANCTSICNEGAKCTNGGGKFFMNSDLSVWYPLVFDASGGIAPMAPLPSYTLELPDY